MVGGSTRIGERSTIKHSVIGKHCVIGRLTKVIGCVLLDHCVIGDGYDIRPCQFLLFGINKFVSEQN